MQWEELEMNLYSLCLIEQISLPEFEGLTPNLLMGVIDDMDFVL